MTINSVKPVTNFELYGVLLNCANIFLLVKFSSCAFMLFLLHKLQSAFFLSTVCIFLDLCFPRSFETVQTTIRD